MLVIELTFPAGKYHATPWGRHVNEGVPEWPPSPYRIVRAIFDTWKRKMPGWPREMIEPLLEALSSKPPVFKLPDAGVTHTRAYLNSNKKDPSRKQLIFDAFVTLDRDTPILCGWRGVTLSPEEEKTLDGLIGLLNFLGRSESWVKARVLSDKGVNDIVWNCLPGQSAEIDTEVETVPVACLIPPDEYKAHPAAVKKRGRMVPIPWVEAITWSSKDVNNAHLSTPPAMVMIDYARSRRCFELPYVPGRHKKRIEVDCIIYSLEGSVPPVVTTSLDIAERFRVKAMGIHKKLAGSPEKVSPRFSGKNPDGRPMKGHRHVYIFPVDLNRDGWLDHLFVFCREPFNYLELLALDRVTSLWQSGGRPDIQLVPVAMGRTEDLFKPSRKFSSVTPFVPPRHYRRGRGNYLEWLFEQLRLEASNHSLPMPSKIEPLKKLELPDRQFRWIEFRRARKGAQIRPGYGFALEFDEEVQCPFALGYASHFGLGLFLPEDI